MTSRNLIEKYFKFFKNKGHVIIPSASLIPENDPSALFISAGMHPLVPFLLGEAHPAGKRLVNNQLCLRTGDIDEVGDILHHTFFEMLGNWSLGDYWKKESITWSYEFLTKELDLDPNKLWITCFEGDSDAPKDTESSEIWESVGISREKVLFLPKKDNWWGPAGETGPCGPDSEIFFETSLKACGSKCKPGCHCGRFFEIWNNVFMQYNRTKDGKFKLMKNKNVDTGMGVDRTTAVLSGLNDDYLVPDLWGGVISVIEKITGVDYGSNKKAHRIIADHIRAAVFVSAEGVLPSNKERGYVLRRLIRRAVRYGKILGIKETFLETIADSVIAVYKNYYPHLQTESEEIKTIIADEEVKFNSTLDRGLREIDSLDRLDGKTAFFLYESYGFPLELTEEIAKEKGQVVEQQVFEKEFKKHQELSRTASAGMFKGGLVDASEKVTKLHTATHLLQAALRKILGEQVAQKGSNITTERLRFDFSFDRKLSEKELKQVENVINKQITENLSVKAETKDLTEAIRDGALHFFAERYGDKVKVYSIGSFSQEICGGPHVIRTGEIGHVRILKQEKVGAVVMRIYATIQ